MPQVAPDSPSPYEMLLRVWKDTTGNDMPQQQWANVRRVLDGNSDEEQRRAMIRDIYEYLHAQQLCNVNARLDVLEQLLRNQQTFSPQPSQPQQRQSWISWKSFLLGGVVGVLGFWGALKHSGGWTSRWSE